MRSRILLVALAAVWTPVRSQAAQYFVSPTGSDAAAGSSASPWKTLQHAANVVGPDDRVTARAGNYVGFYLSTSGTAAAPIEFDADPGVLINQRNATTPDGINLEDASHVIIDGFAVNGMPRTGVRSVGVDGNDFASFVTIRNVTATNNQEWGILTGFVNDLLIEKNVTSGSIDQHGIYVSNSGDRPVIRNNISFNNHDNGIHMNGDASEGGDGIISGAIVSGNIIYNNGTGGGSGINMDGVQNSRIENNLIYGNHASGISLYQIDGGGSSKNNVVVNNTIYEANDARWALNIQDGSTGNSLLNNIMIQRPSNARRDRHLGRQPAGLHQRLQCGDFPIHNRRRRYGENSRPMASCHWPGCSLVRCYRGESVRQRGGQRLPPIKYLTGEEHWDEHPSSSGRPRGFAPQSGRGVRHRSLRIRRACGRLQPRRRGDGC